MIKEIKKELVEQITIKYIAKNGKEFTGPDAERECDRYERRLDREAIEKEFKKLNPVYLYDPLVDWVNCDTEMFLVTLNNKVDYEVRLMDYIDGAYKEVVLNEPESYPCKKLIINMESYAGEYSKEDAKNELIKLISKL